MTRPPALAELSRSLEHGFLVTTAALLLPLTLAASLVPVRSHVAGSNVMLGLVLVVVAIAATGRRVAAIVAALSAGLWFDFLFTKPYQSLAIRERADVVSTLLLVAVAVAVAELAAWGGRQQAHASQQAGFLAGLYAATEAASVGIRPSSVVLDQIAAALSATLHLRRCRFDYGMGLHCPRLEHDGRVVRDREEWPVDSRGLPTDMDVELVVERSGQFVGRFLLTADHDSRPSLDERLAAVAIAAQAAAAVQVAAPDRS
jgi:Domain of unknown function (DUF4118)